VAQSATAAAHADEQAEPDLQRIEDGLFFIVGAPRSGTTLVQAMLLAHPRMTVPPETEFFLKHDPPAAPDRWGRYLDGLLASQRWADQQLDAAEFRKRVESTDRTARSVFLTLLAMHARRCGKPRVGEKSPQHLRHALRIHEIFPSARFVHVYRDPRDVVASQLRMPWGRGSHLGRARSWNKLMRVADRVEAALPAEVYTAVRYESLIDRPEAEARRLCAFLGEPFCDSMLAFEHRREPGFAEREAPWKGRTLSPLSAATVGSFARQLTPRQIAGIERTVGSRLTRLGYRPHQPAGRYRLHWRLRDGVDRLLDIARRQRRSIAKRLRGPGAGRSQRHGPG
jgi:hypothetical protein